MARPKNAIPSYRLHKASGQAVVYLGRKVVYLGQHGTAASKRKYSELLTRLASEPAALRDKAAKTAEPLSIVELVLKYVTEELPRFSRSEKLCQQTALRLLPQLFAETPVSEFGPLKLRVLREAMIAGDPNAKNAKGEQPKVDEIDSPNCLASCNAYRGHTPDGNCQIDLAASV